MKQLFLLALMFAVLSLQAQNLLKAPKYVPGHVLVQFRHGVVPDSILDKNGLAQNQITIDHCISASWNIWLLKTTAGNEENAISYLAHQNGVLTLQLNHYVTKRGVVPNDPLFSPAQWNLLNTGQTVCGVPGAAGADIDATNAWTIITGGYTALGDTIVIAVVDGGADLTHPDLHFWKNTREIPDNGIDDDRNGYIDDYNGWNGGYHNDNIPADEHGTHVCGIAAAIGNNAMGISGVNWTALIMPLALVNYTEDEIVEDYTYVFNQRRDYNQSNGAKGAFVVVTNSSFGVDYGQPADYPLWCAMYDSLGSVGILSAAATTNNDVNVDDVGDMPTACPSNYLVTVTDMTNTGYRNASAGFGPTTIDLDAPGTCITSTLPGGTYGLMSGTSMASPHVAGAIALLYASGCASFIQAYHNNPDSIALIVKQLILAGVVSTPDMVGNSVSGGRLDVYNSMQLLLNQFCDSCMTLAVNTQPILCYGETNGTAAISINNGSPPYKILWSTGDSTPQITGLAAGVYSVQVVDSLHCSKVAYFTLNQPDTLIAGYTIIRPAGDDDSDGVIVTVVDGGVAPYTFQWSNGDTTQDLKGVPYGTYSVTITDVNHCTRQDSVTIYTTGIATLTEEQVKIFPNPTSGDVQVELPSSFTNITADLIDMPGQILWTGQLGIGRYTVPVSLMQKGVYILRLSDGKNEVMKKIVRL